MAVYIDAEVQVRNGAVVISSSTENIVAPDGSLHNVPVINSRVLGRTINGEEAEEFSGEEPTRDDELTEEDEELPDLPDVFCDKVDLFNLLAKHGIIHQKFRCQNCRTDCATRAKSQLSDGFVWQCPQCKKNSSIRTGTIFMGSKLTLTTIFRIIFYWASGVPAHTTLKSLPQVGKMQYINGTPYVAKLFTKQISRNK